MLFQKTLNQAAHAGADAFFFLPVDGAVFAQGIAQLLGDGNQLVVFVEVFDGLGFGQRIIGGQLFPVPPVAWRTSIVRTASK